MFIKSDIYTSLIQISYPELILDEKVVPSKLPLNPNSTYNSDYEWLFGYERKLIRFLEPFMPGYRYKLIGDKGVLCEALSNAFSHGHKRDPDKTIIVRVYRGKKGLLIRIKDSGPGFNIDWVLKNYLKGKSYYHTAGNGINNMTESPFKIFFTDKGRAFNLIYFF